MEKKAKATRIISDTTLDRYLSAILTLRQRIPLVRSVDVANHLGYSKACISMAVKQMTAQALVQIGPHGSLVLTDDGERRAMAHQVSCSYFFRLLVQSGVAEEDAAPEAAAITRALSRPSFEALQRYLADRGVQPQSADPAR